MQQPVRRIVGRKRTPLEQLASMEDMTAFIKNMSPEHSPESKEIFTRFGKLLVALATNKIDFAVVGGVAVIFNGYPRLTLDADILVNVSRISRRWIWLS